jgi:hypothetical protein
MKRILLFAALAGLLLATSGCSNGFLRGGLIGAGNSSCGTTGSGLFGGNVLPTGFLKDGPVRQWLRGDSCDSCNVPAGQIQLGGLDSTCESGLCSGVPTPVVSGPILSNVPSSQPAVNYYPSYDAGVPQVNGVSESEFFGGVSDGVELPPLQIQ